MGEPNEHNAHSDADQVEQHWLANVYQGDSMPQLTLRAVLMGGVLGALMSISHLYTVLKVGWGFGVAITSCILSFAIWNCFRILVPKLTPMSILENNCMQSTASAAGASTGATIATAFGAMLMITGQHVSWPIVFAWTLCTALLGVFMAIPMKRHMINREQLAFPSGIAAAKTLRSLCSRSADAVYEAYALISSLVVGAIVGLVSKGQFAWQTAIGLKLPDLFHFNFLTVRGVNLGQFPGFGFEPSGMLIAAGMITGLRVSVSMFAGSTILFVICGPMLVTSGAIDSPGSLIRHWALWTGTSVMLTSGLTTLALQWRTVLRSMNLFSSKKGTHDAMADRIEVPTSWFLAGVIPISIVMVVLQYVAFSISIPLGILSVVMAFFLGLVACRACGETDITPIGAMGKITQIMYAIVAPGNITTNLMTASVTANSASSAADLLTDLKSGYLLGANPRKQFLAQFFGVFFGAMAVVPAWFLMVPDKAALEAFNPPAVLIWQSVAEALSNGLSYIPVSARWGMLVGGIIGIVISICEHRYPKAKKYMPSAMGLGLSWVLPFASSLSFLIGALIAHIWGKAHKDSADKYVVPIASGALAGESLSCAGLTMLQVASTLGG